MLSFCRVEVKITSPVLLLVLLLMEMVLELQRVPVRLQQVLELQQVLAQDQPQELGVAYLKHCRLNNWSTMKQLLFHNLTGNADGVA